MGWQHILLGAFVTVTTQVTSAVDVDISSYKHTVLEASINYSVYTKVDESNLYIVLAASGQGWLGFGFAEQTSGHMKGSDIVTVTYDATFTKVEDRYADFAPISVKNGVVAYDGLTAKVDEHNDYVHEFTKCEGGTTYFGLRRPLVTGDTQDRDIESGLRRVVWAWGTADTVVGYHGNNRGSGAIDLFGDTVAPHLQGSDGYWEKAVPSYVVPTKTTTYAEMAFEIDVSQTRHIVGFEVIVDPSMVKHVHHLVLFAYASKTAFLETVWNTMTDKDSLDESTKSGKDSDNLGMFYAWALGSGALVLPDQAGFRVSSSGQDLRYILVQMHYDNPSGLTGLTDTTKFRMHYSNTLRPNDAWMLSLGDPFVTFGIGAEDTVNEIGVLPSGQENVHRIGTCPKECTKLWPQDITLFSSMLHMHYYGEKMYTDLYSEDGTFVKAISRIDFWDGSYQITQPVNVTVKPGMSMQTHCHFNTKFHDTHVPFGEATEEEMCIHFALYYPRQSTITNCGYSVHGTICPAAPGGYLDQALQSDKHQSGFEDPLGFTTAPGKQSSPLIMASENVCQSDSPTIHRSTHALYAVLVVAMMVVNSVL